MPAAEGPQGIFRSCKADGAADAGCIGKPANAAGAEKTRGTDPSGVLKRSLRLLPLFLAMPAAAQEIPGCNQDRVGAVACMAGKLCACGYVRGGIVSGRPDGYRWDCGVLRPACGEALPPAAMPSMPMPMPELNLSLPPMTPWLR